MSSLSLLQFHYLWVVSFYFFFIGLSSRGTVKTWPSPVSWFKPCTGSIQQTLQIEWLSNAKHKILWKYFWKMQTKISEILIFCGSFQESFALRWSWFTVAVVGILLDLAIVFETNRAVAQFRRIAIVFPMQRWREAPVNQRVRSYKTNPISRINWPEHHRTGHFATVLRGWSSW